MESEALDQELPLEPDIRVRADVSSVFMMLARRALEMADSSGMPPDLELRRLAAWCELHRNELHKLSKRHDDAESRQRRIWLHELASTPTGRWVDLRGRLASFIRTFGRLPRSQNEPFLSHEVGADGGHPSRPTLVSGRAFGTDSFAAYGSSLREERPEEE